jgi:hypothetical protein
MVGMPVKFVMTQVETKCFTLTGPLFWAGTGITVTRTNAIANRSFFMSRPPLKVSGGSSPALTLFTDDLLSPESKNSHGQVKSRFSQWENCSMALTREEERTITRYKLPGASNLSAFAMVHLNYTPAHKSRYLTFLTTSPGTAVLLMI